MRNKKHPLEYRIKNIAGHRFGPTGGSALTVPINKIKRATNRQPRRPLIVDAVRSPVEHIDPSTVVSLKGLFAFATRRRKGAIALSLIHI